MGLEDQMAMFSLMVTGVLHTYMYYYENEDKSISSISKLGSSREILPI